jgi:hypothetical protein
LPPCLNFDYKRAMDPGWAQLLVAFVGGSLMTAAITAFLTHYVFHPVISVQLDEKKGSHGPVPLIWFDDHRKPTGQSQAKFFRLHVENTGHSSIKDCCGYITKMTKRIQGMGKSEAHLDVISLSWAHKDTETRDIPPGAFFHLDVATLHLNRTGNVLQTVQMPTNLAPFLTDKATYEFDIIIAADNARPRRILVKFDYDPKSDDLLFEPVDGTHYPWWAWWRRLRSKWQG